LRFPSSFQTLTLHSLFPPLITQRDTFRRTIDAAATIVGRCHNVDDANVNIGDASATLRSLPLKERREVRALHRLKLLPTSAVAAPNKGNNSGAALAAVVAVVNDGGGAIDFAAENALGHVDENYWRSQLDLLETPIQ
jgi:hypothetical protein